MNERHQFQKYFSAKTKKVFSKEYKIIFNIECMETNMKKRIKYIQKVH